ncbi:MAG: cupin domain-containing protein [Burkholderiales bacterium]
MKVWTLLAGLLTAPTLLNAETDGFFEVLPRDEPWSVRREVPRLEYALIHGDPERVCPFTFRVRAETPHRLPSHTHPDERTITVISGTYRAGIGKTFEESALRAFPAGSFYVIPAGLPYFSAVLDGEVMFQESGTGPSRNDPVEPRR